LIKLYSILISFFSLLAFSLTNNIKYEINLIDSLSEAGVHYESLIRAKRLYKKHPNNVEAICRMAGTNFIKAQNEKNQDRQKKIFYYGFDYAKKALKLDSLNGYANFWYAAYSGRIGELEGIKQTILSSYDVKKYGLKAINLIKEPYDAAYNMMGRWHYELSDLSEIEKIFATLIYEKLPEGSIEKAIEYFNTAVKIKPNQIRNHYWLGKSYLKAKKPMLAKKEFKVVLSLNPKDFDDEKMYAFAKKSIKSF
jgi:tetratricopeptide (TPR) repeat protein